MTYKPTIFEFIILWHLLLPLDLRNGYIVKRGHGQADRTRRARAAMEKTDSFGKDGQLWKRRIQKHLRLFKRLFQNYN